MVRIMADKMTAINPKILVWAREVSGVTLAEAERKLGKDKLSHWEKGTDYPTYSELRKISKLYRKPIGVFFFPQPPQLNTIPSSFRTLPDDMHSQFSHGIIKLMDKARSMQINLYELNDNKNPSDIILTKITFNTGNTSDNTGKISEIAHKLRALFGSDLSIQKRIKSKKEAFEYWRDCFYRVGIFVFKDAFRDNSISGFCIYDSEFPIIYINNSLSVSRQIFTLFHEAYHLINGTSGVDLLNDTELLHRDFKTKDIEIDCNRFASAFLVPSDDFQKVSSDMAPTDENVAKLASIYHVSNEVILRKFLDNKRILPDYYEQKRKEFLQEYLKYKQKSNGRGNYYYNQTAYKGKHYINLVFAKYYAKQINIVQLANYMDMRIPNVYNFAAIKGWGTL